MPFTFQPDTRAVYLHSLKVLKDELSSENLVIIMYLNIISVTKLYRPCTDAKNLYVIGL